MDILVRALKTTGIRTLVFSIWFLFVGLALIYFLLQVPLTKMLYAIWALTIAIVVASILFFSHALTYLRINKNKFLKIVTEKPQLISDIYMSVMPTNFEANGMLKHRQAIVDYFNITIKLVDKKEEIISVHQKFFHPVLQYIISVAPQAKTHN